jgi:hypothetical protein
LPPRRRSPLLARSRRRGSLARTTATGTRPLGAANAGRIHHSRDAQGPFRHVLQLAPPGAARPATTLKTRRIKEPRQCAGAKTLPAGDKRLISSEQRSAPRIRRSGS